jgi:FkbM family methyltransferase
MTLNKIERAVDEVDPGLSVRLRTLKMRLRHDLAQRLIRDMIGPAEVCVDVGANRGVYTHIMSVKVGSSGRVGNIAVHPLAASDHAGNGVLRIPVHNGHRIDALAGLRQTWTGDGDSCLVSLCTLDELLRGERRVSFLKCDVEGHEQRVFQGAARILSRDRPVVLTELEQRHRDDPIEDTFGFFTSAGYAGWFVAQGRLWPLEEFNLARDQLAFLDGRFIPYAMPAGYVYDFLFCPPGAVPPCWSVGRQMATAR